MKTILKTFAFYKVLPVRHRYIFTRSNTIRLRYVCASLVIGSMTAASFLGAMGSSVAFAPLHAEIARGKMVEASPQLTLASVSPGQQSDVVSDQKFSEDEDHKNLALSPLLDGAVDQHVADAPQNIEKLLKIAPGDTMAGVLQKSGVSAAEAYRAVKALSKHFDPRSIKPGQTIAATFSDVEGDAASLMQMSMKLSPVKEIVVAKDEHERFSAEVHQKATTLEMKAAKASIQTSLYGSAARAGIPATVIAEMIRIYSYEVDFQRDIRQGDTVEIFYETYETESGDFARYGDIVHANLTVSGQSIPVYRFETKDGLVDYFKEDGRNLKRTLMMTPIDGARMSSGYGMRRHPVLGYNKMHKGVDFAAPRGTPIYAAGDGVIEKASRYGGYGKYVRIRHNGALKTAYAHMHKFAKKTRVGKRVKQGEIIGYVGTTGRSTGPHLHFEVLQDGRQINPRKVKSSAGKKLAGADLETFKTKTLEIKQQYATISEGLKFAKNEITE